MALSDPKTVTINAVPSDLARVDVTGSKSIYSKDDGLITLTVSHQNGKRKRAYVRLDVQKTAPDPLISATAVIYNMSAALTVDRPLVGFTIAEQKQIVDGLVGLLTATTGADTTKILGGQS